MNHKDSGKAKLSNPADPDAASIIYIAEPRIERDPAYKDVPVGTPDADEDARRAAAVG